MKIIFTKNNNKPLLIFFILYWILLWASINTAPSEIYFFNQGYKQSINAARILFPLLASMLIFFLYIYIYISEKIKLKKIEFFFLLFFASQIIGLYFNKERSFDINNLYLAILAIGSICLFTLCNHKQINNIIKYFIYISILFLVLALFFAFLGKFDELNNLNFYKIFAEHDKNLLDQANPRITGISRMLAIINLFLILYFFSLKNFYLKNFLLFFLLLSTMLLFFMESRGTLLCYFTSITIVIFFLIRGKNIFKLKYFFILFLLPILFYFFINYFFSSRINLIDQNAKINSRILNTTTSGRYEIWSYTIKNYDYKKNFGYGPNGDRFFLKDFDKKKMYGDNTSNIWFYTLVSGGVISIFFLVLIFFEIIKLLKEKKKIPYKNLFYYNFSIICLVFFFIRSFFENSFGLFSIDFLITYLSLSYIVSSTQRLRNK
jgi:hypothetical protein